MTPYLASPLCIHKHCFSAVKYALEATTGPSNHHMMRKMYQSYFTHSMGAQLDDSGSVTSIFWKIFEDELRKGKKFRFFMDFLFSIDMLKNGSSGLRELKKHVYDTVEHLKVLLRASPECEDPF